MIRSSLTKWVAASVLALPVVPALAAGTHHVLHKTVKHTTPTLLAAHTAHARTLATTGLAGRVVHHHATRHVGRVAAKHRLVHHTVAKHVRTHHAATASKWAPPATSLSASRAALRSGAVAHVNTHGTPLMSAQTAGRAH